jgi:hypothetical protein
MQVTIQFSDDVEAADLEQQLPQSDHGDWLITLDEFCVEEFGCTYIQVHKLFRGMGS